MPSFRQATIVLLIALTMVSCRRDPATAKKRYLESGNSYLDKGRFRKAAIQYQNAIKIDPKYGPAHYKLGGVYLNVKPAAYSLAVKEYRIAVELLKGNQAYQEEYKQSMIRLSEILLAYAPKDDQTILNVKDYCEQLFKKDPNSFDGFRLTGELNFRLGQQDLLDGKPTEADGEFNTAMENYRKANAIKPGDSAVSMKMGIILWQQKHYAEAEPYLRRTIDNDKTFNQGYIALYRLYIARKKTAEAEQLLKEDR